MMKRTKKKAKGIEKRIQRQEFYNTLKHPPVEGVEIRDTRFRPNRRKTKLIIKRDISGYISDVRVTHDN